MNQPPTQPTKGAPMTDLTQLTYLNRNFVAYNAFVCEYEWFETFEQAAAWLKNADSEDISDEMAGGLSFIARVTHRTGFAKTDEQKNYHQHTKDCPTDCDEEEWPYDSDWEFVGKIVFVPVEDNPTEATQ